MAGMDGSNQSLPLRVVVVDADDLVRESLVGLLGIGRRVTVVGAAAGAEPALDLVRRLHPDVVVVDPRLPELAGGLDFIGRVKTIADATAVLVVGSADILERAAARPGVDGFLRKTFRPDDLTDAILAAGRRAAG
jgi:DNA-binding NarL/FixJ family response regulator